MANPKEYGGIVVYCTNEVREQVDGVSKIVPADFFINDDELEKTLEGARLLSHIY